jgi:transcriptional regulator with XRE-family HTH domain
VSSFSERLRQVLAETGLSQREFARVADVSRQAVEKWLASKAIPDRRSLTRISIALGTTTEWLLKGRGEPPARGGRFNLPAIEFYSQLAAASDLLSPVMAEYQRMLDDVEGHRTAIESKMSELSKRWHAISAQIFNRTLGERKNLQSKSEGLDVAAMRSTPTLPELLSRVRTLTREYGSRQKLAKKLKIKPQQLNAWLAGAKEPGGDYTLKILALVQELEAQRKQSVEGALKPPMRKTRFSSKPSYEKAKSGPNRKSGKKRR